MVKHAEGCQVDEIDGGKELRNKTMRDITVERVVAKCRVVDAVALGNLRSSGTCGGGSVWSGRNRDGESHPSVGLIIGRGHNNSQMSM